MKDVRAQCLSFKEKINCTHLGKTSPSEVGITFKGDKMFSYILFANFKSFSSFLKNWSFFGVNSPYFGISIIFSFFFPLNYMLHLSQCDQKISWFVAKNALTIIPTTISSCKSLMKLDVSDNMITSLPSTLDQLNELVEFDCHGNQLIALPSTMGHLKNIQQIECLGNLLTEPGLTIYLQVIDKSFKYFCIE
jgi:hypothetical protein